MRLRAVREGEWRVLAICTARGDCPLLAFLSGIEGTVKSRSFAELYKDAEQAEEYWVAGAILELTDEVVQRMEEQGVSRSELARRLGTSPAYVTKLLRGNANLTLASMVRLARALESELHCHLTPAARAAGRRELRKPPASAEVQAVRPRRSVGSTKPRGSRE